jgi:ketosteroid isomerase-like protein
MSREQHLATVTAAYAAFGAGDIPAVLGHFDADVEWVNQGPADIEYFGTKRGHDGALAVFGFLGAHIDISVFDPHTLVADDERVVALVHVVGTARSTGATYDEETVHVFDFGPDGRVTRFRDFQDTAAVAGALGNLALR